ncbi:Hypothetical predicted protein [Paramuricea clavata]|uniref:Uncharacterized protein n=1 Tax=Paramuricea clavata TaxID=317549 RepID=A0A6S7I7D5_PARCT|nr:Hypothetical predicted protein [Paramuricea clavata]
MSAKTLCFLLVILVISYDIEAFTAGAGNIGSRGIKRGLVNKDFRIFKNICTWASEYCPSNADNWYATKVAKNEETPNILETEKEILSQK